MLTISAISRNFKRRTLKKNLLSLFYHFWSRDFMWTTRPVVVFGTLSCLLDTQV